MPLANQASRVAPLLQPLSKSRLLEVQRSRLPVIARAALGIGVKAEPLLVAASEQARPAGAANAASYIAIGKAHAIGCQRVDVRCGDFLAARGAQAPVAQVVGVNEDNIWQRVRRDGGCKSEC